MFRFAGYTIKNQNGDVVQYSPNRANAEQFCQQHGLPGTNITKVYEWRAITEYVPPPPPPEGPIDLQPSQ